MLQSPAEVAIKYHIESLRTKRNFDVLCQAVPALASFASGGHQAFLREEGAISHLHRLLEDDLMEFRPNERLVIQVFAVKALGALVSGSAGLEENRLIIEQILTFLARHSELLSSNRFDDFLLQTLCQFAENQHDLMDQETVAFLHKLLFFTENSSTQMAAIQALGAFLEGDIEPTTRAVKQSMLNGSALIPLLLNFLESPEQGLRNASFILLQKMAEDNEMNHTLIAPAMERANHWKQYALALILTRPASLFSFEAKEQDPAAKKREALEYCAKLLESAEENAAPLFGVDSKSAGPFKVLANIFKNSEFARQYIVRSPDLTMQLLALLHSGNSGVRELSAYVLGELASDLYAANLIGRFSGTAPEILALLDSPATEEGGVFLLSKLLKSYGLKNDWLISKLATPTRMMLQIARDIPADLWLYCGAYIFVGLDAATPKLHYVNDEGVLEDVTITDYSVFQAELKRIAPDRKRSSAGEIMLYPGDAHHLITLNGGHVPVRVQKAYLFSLLTQEALPLSTMASLSDTEIGSYISSPPVAEEKSRDADIASQSSGFATPMMGLFHADAVSPSPVRTADRSAGCSEQSPLSPYSYMRQFI